MFVQFIPRSKTGNTIYVSRYLCNLRYTHLYTLIWPVHSIVKIAGLLYVFISVVLFQINRRPKEAWLWNDKNRR